MKLTSLIARAFRGLKTARVRTLLTALAIAVGGFVLTLTLAASTGAKQFVDQIISDNLDPRGLIVSKMDLSGADEFTKPQLYNPDESADNSNLRYLNEAEITQLRGYDFIESVNEAYTVNPLYIQYQDEGERYKATIASDNPMQRPELIAGTVGAALPEGEIIVSDAYREAFGLGSSAELVGKTITVVMDSPRALVDPSTQPLIRNFKVAGVGKTGFLSSGGGAGPLGVFVSTQDAQQLSDFSTQGTPAYRKYLSADVLVKNGDDPVIMKQVQEQLKADGFNSQSAADTQDMVGQIIDVLQGIVLGFGFVTVVASVFGVINTMYISVLERTREIGLMKALGMSQRALKWLFRIEAAWIGLLGGVIGSLLGWGVGSILNPWISKQLDLETHLLVFPVGQIALMILGLMIVAMLAGMLPARKAAKLDPVEALRTE